MIYTVTFNPALDFITQVANFKVGEINRSIGEQILSGGKGINVSVVLHNLGVKSTALGFIAGFTGEEIERGVKALGCCAEFIHLEQGLSRINVKIRSEHETAINTGGPDIPQEKLAELIKRLDKLTDDDILVLAGSIPSSLPENTYQAIMAHLQPKNVRIVVDATGKLLLNVLKYRPFLIKPNREELEEVCGESLYESLDIIHAAKQLQKQGARNVLISMGGRRGNSSCGNRAGSSKCCTAGKVINTVGAGDSMVTGFLAGYLPDLNYNNAFRIGIAAGSASAFSESLATKEEVFAPLGSAF